MTRLRHRRTLSTCLPVVLLVLLALTLAPARRGVAPQGYNGTADLEQTALTGPRGGRLLRAAVVEPRTFNPLLAIDTASWGVIGPLFDGLVARIPTTLKMKPALAKSWERSADGRTWTFHLRGGLRWSDGQPVTADDVLFTLDAIYDPRVTTRVRDILQVGGKPLRYGKVDDRTVRFTLPSAFGPFLDTLDFAILPKHKLAAALKTGRLNATWGIDTPPGEIVGTGPFVLSQFLGGQKTVHRRNPYYWRLAKDGKRLPFLDAILTQFVPDANAVLLRFRAGETDSLNVRAEDWASIRQGSKAGGYRTFDLGPSWTMGYLVFNMNPRSKTLPSYKRDWFSKNEFRQAVSYALDRRSMIQTVGRGIGRPEWSPVTEANRLFYNPKVRRYPHDPSRAKAMLRRLGFADRKHNGILEDAAGHELAFTLIAGTGNSAVATICSIIQDDLKQVGMKVTVSLMEYQALLSRRDRYDWECNLNGWSGDPEPHRSQTIWLSSGRAHFWNPLQPRPATPWEAEIDRIFARAAQETEYGKRKALYDRWQAIIAEEQPLIFLTTPDVLGAIRGRVRNARPTSLSGLLWNLDELAI